MIVTAVALATGQMLGVIYLERLLTFSNITLFLFYHFFNVFIVFYSVVSNVVKHFGSRGKG